MNDVEGIGEAVSGVAVARAVEPAAGESALHGEAVCLNCGAPLAGPHCHQCGQSAHIHRTLGAWWHDLAHGVLHLDGKIWRTLPLLAVKPGELTRRYIAGERANFVSPLALFLFATFLMFATFSLMNAPLIGAGDSGDPLDSKDIAAEATQVEKRIAEMEKQRAAAAASPAKAQQAAALDRKIAEAKRERDALAAAGKYFDSRGGDDWNFETKWARLDQGVQKARKNPALLFYKMQANAYKFSWALIPLSLPFLWVLFLHRRRYRTEYGAYDHIVFVTYSIAFMSLGMVALVALTAVGVGSGAIALAAIFIPPVHIFLQLRGAYQLRKRSALWRTVALLFFSQTAIGLFFLLLLALGVLG
jgi:hypothetical protein